MTVTPIDPKSPSQPIVNQPDVRLRSGYLQILSTASIIVGLALLLLLFFGAETEADEGLTEGAAVDPVVWVVFIAVNATIILFVRSRQLSPSRMNILYVVQLGLLALATVVLNEDFYEPIAILTLLTAATVGNWAIYGAANLLVFSKVIYTFIDEIQEFGTFNHPDVTHDWLLLIALIIVSILTRYFAENLRRSAQQSRRSNDLLRATAMVGQEVSRVLDLNELLTSAANTIRERFDFYHVQVFLVDEKTDQAALVASTGEAGQRLLERKHQLAVGSRSVIGQVTARGEPIIAYNTENDPVHSRNELLPDTRSELALPIRDGDHILGALDVQSERANAFENEDIQALEVMTGLLATAIRNARLFEAQMRSVQENQRLFIETEANLREIQRLNRQLTHSAWTDFLHGGKITTGITLESNRIVDDVAWTDRLTQATSTRQPVTGSGVIAVPVVLRGEVIGAIEVAADPDMPDGDTLEVVQAVADRLAISLDNARLFEEAQEATVQEQRINAIVAQLQSVSSVDDLLRVTLTELSQSLGADHGAIRLGSPPAENLLGAASGGMQNGSARTNGSGNGSAAS